MEEESKKRGAEVETLRRRVQQSEDRAGRPPRPLQRSPSNRQDTHRALEGIVQGLQRKRSDAGGKPLSPTAERMKENLERVVRL